MNTMNPAQTHSSKLTRRMLASGAIGNILETYDLILISLMATTLSQIFFPPAENQYAHVIDIFYIFFLGLLVRPIGNILMGLMADQLGRKKLMIISLILTGISTFCIGLLPSYHSIGIWSTTLFVLLRISQNFFSGIEYINSATYLVENSPKKMRGFFCSWTAIGISGGYLLASIVALTISHLITKNYIPEWSWRFIFLFSLIGVGFGIWIRYSIPESLVFMMNNAPTDYSSKLNILKNSFTFIKNNPRRCLSISALTILGTYLSFIYYVYIPTHLIMMRNFNHNEVLSINVISLLLVVLLIPLFGKLSDYYNRIILLKIICFIISLLAIPFFWSATYGSYSQIIFFTLLISIPSSCFFSLYPAVITESFPSKIRCATASLIYQIVISVTMGTLPLLVAYLTKSIKLPYSPAYLLIISTAIGFLSLLYLGKIETEDDKRNIGVMLVPE